MIIRKNLVERQSKRYLVKIGGVMRVVEWNTNDSIPEAPERDSERFAAFNDHIGTGRQITDMITPESPQAYWTAEIYDKKDLGIKGGGGLGVLAGDTRRIGEDLGVPMVVVTPFYPIESHQELAGFRQHERYEQADPERLYRRLGRVAISTSEHPQVDIDVYDRQLGSTRVFGLTEPNFGELYHGENNGDHRLYQNVALGFGGYMALKRAGYDPAVWQMNEAPTVFAAVAMLDDLCQKGIPFEEALGQVKAKSHYINHTLVQAVEGVFTDGQFNSLVMPNIGSHEVRAWLQGLFTKNYDDESKLRLSLLAIELSGKRSGVSKIHADVADFRDAAGNKVEFEAVTNGISNEWIMPEAQELYASLGVLDEFGLPTDDYAERLATLSMKEIRLIRRAGRNRMNEILTTRKDQYGNPIVIPDSALVYDFKRRFANYKRPEMVFSDPERLADLLKSNNAHFLLTGKPHASDGSMKSELTQILELIDRNKILRNLVHYVQDYDEDVGKALSFGADCAINVPVVGMEACGTSFMKDIANLKLLISTPDGGVADINPIACLEVSGGNEAQALYERMGEAVAMLGDDARYRQQLLLQLRAYLPVISGARMMADYLKLYARTGVHQEALLAI